MKQSACDGYLMHTQVNTTCSFQEQICGLINQHQPASVDTAGAFVLLLGDAELFGNHISSVG